MRGAWIEMVNPCFAEVLEARSLPMRGAWIEIICLPQFLHMHSMSLPMRGAWIEIENTGVLVDPTVVAPHAGSVD